LRPFLNAGSPRRSQRLLYVITQRLRRLAFGVAVKDLIAVDGFPTGGGVPAYLASQPRQQASAPLVTALRLAGAHLAGIAQTDPADVNAVSG